MFKLLKYLLLLTVFILIGSSCSSKKSSSKKKPTTYYPNQRKAPSGKTNNCDCPSTTKKGRTVSNVKPKKMNGIQPRPQLPS